MKNDTELQAAYKKLEEAEANIKRLNNEWKQMYRVQQLLVAAGLVTEEKIRQAEDLARI